MVFLALIERRNTALAPVPAACSQIPEASASSTSAQLIKRGDRNLAFHVTPGKPGNDTYIVLDAGGGLDASYWNDFVPTLSQRTGATIITHDRAGMGQSDEAPGPWDLNEATRDLEHGLEKLHATRNVILVSHSLAGEIATALVGRHPDWFTGGVLVDANVPDVYTEDFISRAGYLRTGLGRAPRRPSHTPGTPALGSVGIFRGNVAGISQNGLAELSAGDGDRGGAPAV